MRNSERKMRIFHARAGRMAGMKGFRFSLWSMFLGVAAVSIVCAALVKPTQMWAMAFQAASLGVLTFAILAALVYERGSARAFWIGFAVVGWGNLGWQELHLPLDSLTGEVSEWLMEVIHPDPAPLDPAALQPPSVMTDPFSHVAEPAIPAASAIQDARNTFSYLVFWIWPPLFGLIGGVVAKQLYLRRERLAARPSPSSSGPIS